MNWLSELWSRLRRPYIPGGLSPAEPGPLVTDEPREETPITVPIVRIAPVLPAGMITEHFSWGEFGCRDGAPVPPEHRANTVELCGHLEALRAELRAPIRVISGYRSPAYNDRVKGASDSQHLTGRAADIRVRGVSPQVVHAAILRLIARGKMAEGGLGLYLPRTATATRAARLEGWCHYDCRGARARWVG